jgi:hypothetical protein
VDRDILHLECYDWNRIQKHSLIGMINIPLHELTFKRGSKAQFEMNLSNLKGTVRFELTALDFDTTPTLMRRSSTMVLKKPQKKQEIADKKINGQLAINFKSAYELAAMDVGGTSGTYHLKTLI